MKTGRVKEVEPLPAAVSGLQERKSKAPVSSFKPVLSPGVDGKKLAQDIFSAHIKSLMSLLNRDSPRQAPLFSVLQMLQNLPSGSRDARLVMSLLGRWENLQEEDLPGEVREKLASLKDFFPQEKPAGRHEDDRLLFQEEPGPLGGKPPFRLKVRREKGGKRRASGRTALILEMNLPFLGALEVSVTPGRFHSGCCISCGKKDTMFLIRKALPDLKKRLSGGKASPPRIFVRQNPGLSSSSSGSFGEKGVCLWG